MSAFDAGDNGMMGGGHGSAAARQHKSESPGQQAERKTHPGGLLHGAAGQGG